MKNDYLEPNMKRWYIIGGLNLLIFIFIVMLIITQSDADFEVALYLITFTGGMMFAWVLTYIGWKRRQNRE